MVAKPIRFEDLCDIINRRRFTPAERSAVRNLSDSERERLIAHAKRGMAEALATMATSGSA